MPQASLSGSKPTARVRDLKDRFLALQPSMSAARAEIYYEVYREYQNYPVVLKRAIALRETLARLPVFIFPGELILGHPAAAPRAAEAFPEVNMAFMGDLDEFETREYNRLRVASDVKASLRAMEPWWRGKTLTDHFRATRHPAAAAGIAAGLFSNSHEWSGFAHVAMDYRKLLDKGVDGLLQEVEIRREALDPADPEYPIRTPFYQALAEICRGILIFADRYRALALESAAEEADPGRRAELKRLAAILERVPRRPAGNFREAIQSFWFQQLIPQIESNGFSITPGRFDQYMWPYLEQDLASGAITMGEAQELVDMIFLKFCEILRVDSTGSAEINAGYAAGQNLVAGGLDAQGRDATNPLSRMCLRSNLHVGLQQPNFTVRLHRNTPKDFLDQAVESIARGNGMPQVLNDELIIPSLVRRGMTLAEARDYIPVGCD
ncbi:MAG: pyruvate formate lyase family protein, partial [Planctomycetota bacterium]|nr:pyruvate formate lyase family protein [Planctomycetota bacterium]